MLVPLGGEVEPALLHPALEIPRGDVIGVLQQRAVGMRKRDRRLLHRDAILDCRRGTVNGYGPSSTDRVAASVLHHVSAAVLHVIQQPRLVGAQVGAHVVGAHAGHDGVEARQVALLQVRLAEQRDFQPNWRSASGISSPAPMM